MLFRASSCALAGSEADLVTMQRQQIMLVRHRQKIAAEDSFNFAGVWKRAVATQSRTSDSLCVAMGLP